MIVSVMARTALMVLLGLSATEAASGQQANYDTDRIIKYTGNECTAANGPCRTIKSQPIWLKAGQQKVVAVGCPRAFPHVVGWDARHREHVSLTLLPTMPGQRANATTQSLIGRFSAIQLAVTNHGNASGGATIFLGCSTKPFTGGGFAMSRGAMPSRDLRAAIR